MENVYKFPATDIINIKEFLDTFRSETLLQGNLPLPACDEDIKRLLEIDDTDTYQKLQESVDLDAHLSQPDDVRVFPFKPKNIKSQLRKPIVEIPKQSLHLNTLRELIMYKKKFYGNPFGPTVFNYAHNLDPSDCGERDLKPYEDVLISIRVYHPFASYHVGIYAKPKFSQEFIVRGQQYLTELRDKISCACKRPLYDVSENPERDIPPLDVDPGFFFITDTFYNDTRNPANPDYSDVIMKWAETRPRGTFTSKFKTAKMEETKFLDLSVRIGFPQVYQHFGNCEHLLTFSWIQLISPGDCLSSKPYPLLKSVKETSKPSCSICGEREYTFVVRGSNRHMHDPVYMCRICFNSFHYVDGVKQGKFQAYCENPEPMTEVLVGMSEDEEEGGEEVDAEGDE